MTIQGYATPSGTQAVSQTYTALPYAPLADTGLLVGRVGGRSQRQVTPPETQATLLNHAMAQGVNLVDTSKIEGELDMMKSFFRRRI